MTDLNVSTINLRVLAAASAFACKDEARYYLMGVCLEIEPRAVNYVACNGHSLIAYRSEIDDPDQPDNLLIGRFIIPTAHCKSHKLTKDDVGTAKIFGNGRLTIAHDFVDVTFMPIDGIYVDWRKIVPRSAVSGVLSQYNAEYLAAYKKFGDALDHGSPFVAHNGDGPALIYYSQVQHCFGALMPIKLIDEMGRVAPDWARAPADLDQGDIEDHLSRADEANLEKVGRGEALEAVA
ncbi:MAG: polymerase beta subunit, central domain protein [Massilia sp.]|nr:polymerase beta subunit, central domain protein [Massilia sp.]